MNNNKLNVWVERQIVFWGSIGIIWFLSWILNPNIDSGTVWLLAFIFAALETDIYTLGVRQK